MRRDVFQAIADPTRREIISMLATKSLNLNSVAENFNVSRPAISKHIKILSECELIQQEQVGREIYYKLEVEKMKAIDQWLEQFRKIWETKFSQIDEVLLTIKNK